MSFNMHHSNIGRTVTGGKYEMVTIEEYSWEGWYCVNSMHTDNVQCTEDRLVMMEYSC